MTPATNLVTFAGLGLVVAAAVLLKPSVSSIPRVTALLAFPAFLSLLLLAAGLSRYATLLLAAGSAVQTGLFRFVPTGSINCQTDHSSFAGPCRGAGGGGVRT